MGTNAYSMIRVKNIKGECNKLSINHQAHLKTINRQLIPKMMNPQTLMLQRKKLPPCCTYEAYVCSDCPAVKPSTNVLTIKR